MKRKLSYFLYCLLLCIVALTSYAYAATSTVSFDLVNCEGFNFTTPTGLTNCYNGYKNGSLNSLKVTSGDKLTPGTNFLLVINVTPSTSISDKITQLQSRVNFSSDYFELIELINANTGAKRALTGYDINQYPLYDDGWGDTVQNWVVNTSYGSNYVFVLSKDGSSGDKTPLINGQKIHAAYYGLRLKDDAPEGSQTTITLGKDYTEGTDLTGESGRVASTTTYNSTNPFIVKTTGSSTSTDATIGTLMVKNGSTSYTLDKEVQAGVTNPNEYTAYIPNNITDVNILASSNDSKVKGFSSNDGLSDMDLTSNGINCAVSNIPVGESSYQFTITSETGNTELYTVKLYRLSNDATLSNLSLSNSINIGTFSSNTTTYSNLNQVPYQTTSTNISYTLNNNHPKGVSINGNENNLNTTNPIPWVFQDSVLETNNQKQLTVYAEDCSYDTIVGHNCTSKTYTINVLRSAANTDASLSSLKVNNTSVPNFQASTLTYTFGTVDNNLTVPYSLSSVNVQAVTTDSNARITSGTGTKNLNVGDNILEVVTLAEDKATTKTYTINIHRRSNDATIKNLQVTSNPQATLTAVYGKTNEYNYYYDDTVTAITISADTNNQYAKSITIKDVTNAISKSGTGNTVSETYGVNTAEVLLTVTAEDGNIETYKINLARKLSSDNSLSSLTFDNGTLNEQFQASKKSGYTMDVSPEIDSLTVTAIPTSSYATIKSISGNTNLQFGNNTLTVTVEAEDHSTTDYIVTVNRLKYNIATLSDLRFSYGETKDTLSEPITLSEFVPNSETPNEFTLYTEINPLDYKYTYVNIEADKTNSYSSISGVGKQQLNTGDNTYTIRVVSQDQSKTVDYKIHVYRHKNTYNETDSLKVKGVTCTKLDDTTFAVTLPNSVSSIVANDVLIETSNEATVHSKDASLNLKTKKVIGEGNYNIYNYKIKAEDGQVKSYQIKITRENSSDATISSITLRLNTENTGTRTLNPSSNDEFTFNVPAGTSGYYLDITTTSPEASLPTDAYLEHTMGSGINDSMQEIDLTVTAEDGNTKVYRVNVLRNKSNITYLSSLKVKDLQDTEYSLDPTFIQTTRQYQVIVPGLIDKVNIEALKVDPKSTIVTDLSTPFNLNFGNNTIKVQVKAEDNQTIEEYNLVIVRQMSVERDLQEITINGRSINDYLNNEVFQSDKYEYDLKAFDYNTTSLNIGYTHKDTQYGIAKIGDNNLPYMVTINTTKYNNQTDYTNVITIRSYAQDREKYHDYKLNVKRNPNTDTTIASVAMTYDGTSHTATWNENDRVYELTVPNNITSASQNNIIVNMDNTKYKLTTDTRATYEVATKSLLTNDPINGNVNDVPIIVTAEDKTTTKTYTLRITRTKSNVATLKTLKIVNKLTNQGIGGWSPSFDPTDKTANQTYTVSIPTEYNDFKVVYEKNEPNETVTGDGDYTLQGSSRTIEVVSTSEDGQTTINYNLRIERVASNVTTLSSIDILGSDNNSYNIETINPNNNNYQITVPGDVDSVVINPNEALNLPSGVHQTIELLNPDMDTNKYNIPSGGSKVISIKVTAEDNTSYRTYQITVLRTKRENYNLSLLQYKLNNESHVYSVNLEPDVYSYTLPRVDNVHSIIQFFPTTEDNNASIISGDTRQQLLVGENTLKIKVAAENTSVTKEYELKIVRLPSEDTSLTRLELKDYPFAFNKDTLEYNIDVLETLTSIEKNNVLAVSLDSNATIIKDEDLLLTSSSNGYINTYNILVKAEDCNPIYQDIVEGACHTKTYKLNVHKPLSSDTKFNTITISGGTLNPDYNVNDVKDTYNIAIPYGRDEFEISATPHSPSARSITGTGIKRFSELVADSEGVKSFNVTVTAEDGTIKTYLFTVTMTPSSEAGLSSIVIKDSNNKTYLSSNVKDNNNNSFNKDLMNYEITVIKNITKLKVNSNRVNSDAEVSYLYNDEVISSCNNQNSCYITLNEEAGTSVIKLHTNSPDASKQNDYVISVIKNRSTNNDLTNIVATKEDDTNINLVFDKDTLEYNLQVDYETDKVYLDITKDDDIASLYVDEQLVISPYKKEVALTAGMTTTVNIKVVAEDTTEKLYKVLIKRDKYLASPDASLTALSVVGYDFIDNNQNVVSFDTNVREYNIGRIPFDVTNLTIEASKNSNFAHLAYKVNDTAQSSKNVIIPKIDGNGKIYVIVTAEDGTVLDYIINYNKQASDNNYLSSLSVEGYTINPVFDKDTVTYDIGSIPYKLTELTINATKEDDKAIITYKANNLESTNNVVAIPKSNGTNIPIEVKVRSESGATRTYKILYSKSIGTDATLSNIIIDNHELNPTFESGITEYTVTTEEDTVDLTAIVSDTNAKVAINNANYVSGTKITINSNTIVDITVTAEDNETEETYQVAINKVAVPKEITSDIFGHTIGDGYIKTIALGKTVLDVKNELDNDNELLYVYSADGSLLKGDNDLVGTGMIVKLIIDDTEYDRKIIVVNGDTSGDGVIKINDVTKIVNHIIQRKPLTGAYLLAADTSGDGIIKINDVTKTVNHIIKRKELDYPKK